MRRSSSLASSIALSLTLSACPPTETPQDAGSDAGVLSCGGNTARSVRSPDGEGFCCLPESPTCSCASAGGFVTDEMDCLRREGGRVCEVVPADWLGCTTDEHGCPRVTIASPPTAFCNSLPIDVGMWDGGPASLPDAGSDAPSGASECETIGGTCTLPSGPPSFTVVCPSGSQAIPGSDSGFGGYRQLGCGNVEGGPLACCVPTFDCDGAECPVTSICVHRSGPSSGPTTCEERPVECRDAMDCSPPCAAETDCIAAVCGISFLESASIEGTTIECWGF